MIAQIAQKTQISEAQIQEVLNLLQGRQGCTFQ